MGLRAAPKSETRRRAYVGEQNIFPENKLSVVEALIGRRKCRIEILEFPRESPLPMGVPR